MLFLKQFSQIHEKHSKRLQNICQQLLYVGLHLSYPAYVPSLILDGSSAGGDYF